MKFDIVTIGKFTIHGYGLMIAIGILCCIALANYRAKKRDLSADYMTDIAIYGIVFGFLGAKLLYLIVEWKTFITNPMSVIGGSGFVVYGGIIAGIAAAYVYCRIRKISFLKYIDIATPSIALAQGFGRIGCFLAGCCYGRETHSAFGVVFPEHSMAPAGVKLIPTQLISSAGDFLIMAILLLYARKNPKDGNVSTLYIILYAFGRFAVEFLRADNRGSVGILSTSQFIAVIVGVLATIFAVIRHKRTV